MVRVSWLLHMYKHVLHLLFFSQKAEQPKLNVATKEFIKWRKMGFEQYKQKL